VTGLQSSGTEIDGPHAAILHTGEVVCLTSANEKNTVGSRQGTLPIHHVPAFTLFDQQELKVTMEMEAG
jgi:hypothetical protein